MDVFSFIQLFGGLAFFLFGMNQLSASLEKMTGGKLEKLLKKATDNKFKGLAIGALITIAIQSSSAMTVMLVGFVNSGIMDFGQTIGVIFGSDIGTTLTAWILSLAGIDSGGSIVLGLLKPKNFSLVFALIGVIFIMMSKKQKKKDLGNMLLGFAILMTGMSMMSSSMDPLAESESFRSLLTAFNNPLLGVLVGTLITGVIQSSAASIGMIQSLSLTGALTYGMSIPLIMGANIGTCMTAILSCIGVGRNAKRVSVVHVSVKIIGTAFWLIVFYGLNAIFHFDFMQGVIGPLGVAGAHSIFNILTVSLLFPFSKLLEKLAMRIIKDKPEDKEIFLDERLMATPSFAIGECVNSMRRMIARVEMGIEYAADLVRGPFDAAKYEKVLANEDKIDRYEDLIGAYLMKLTTTQSLSMEDKKKATTILQALGEFERLGDHASYIANSINELNEKGIKFSPEAQAHLNKLITAVRDVLVLAEEAYARKDVITARKIEPLNSVIHVLCDELKHLHVVRQAAGICGSDQGYVFNDILTSCARIGGHSMNIAAIIIRVSQVDEELEANEYMHSIKHRNTEEDERLYDEYMEKYSLDYTPDKG